jgi:fermentation-respiration switch protein FrsA (DUF1100 family)
MGARTAVRVVADPQVVGVVGLAPWLPQAEPVAPLASKQLALAHGTRDRITSLRATEELVRRAAGVVRTAYLRDMGPVGHYLLHDVPAWNAFALDQSLAMLT